MNLIDSGKGWRSELAAASDAAWSDACLLEDLAVLDTGFTEYTQALDLGEAWPVRWSTTWKFGQTPITSPVRDLNKVDHWRSVPVRRFSWRTDQFHRPGLEYLMATDRHHGALFKLRCLTASWTVLRNDEAPGRRVLDQDHPCQPGASRACLPVLD